METVMTYVGGAVSLAGLGFALAFVGRRTADPLATALFGSVSLPLRVAGFVGGLVVAFLGVVVAIRLGDEELVAAALDRAEE